MRKEAGAERKRNRLTGIDKIEEEGEKVSKRIKEISEENERGFRELRERVSKTSEEVAKTSEEIRKLKTEISRLTGSWGEFVEDMIEPSSIKFMEEKGFKVVRVHSGDKVSKNGMNAEYDLYLVCEKKSNNNNRKKKKLFCWCPLKQKSPPKMLMSFWKT